jgi:hypothetical protein
MRVRRGLPILAILALAGVALADERGLKEARANFLKAAGTPQDGPRLEQAAAILARADPPQGALALVELGLGHDRRLAALAAQKELTKVRDSRVARALAARLGEVRAARERRLLCEALTAAPGEEVSRALLQRLGDPDATVRAAAAEALGARGGAATTAASTSGALCELTRRDSSPRVRHAALSSLVKLGFPPASGFDAALVTTFGLPTRFFDARVAFLVDASLAAREAAFSSPAGVTSALAAHASSPAAAAAGTHASAESCYEISCAAVSAGLRRLESGQRFDLVCFDSAVKTFAAPSASARSSTLASEWLRDLPLPDFDARDVSRALSQALDQHPPPDELFVFLCGAPEGRDVVATGAADLADRAWNEGVRVNVVLFDPEPPPDALRSERDRLSLSRVAHDRRVFAEQLASTTGGRFTLVSLGRFVPGPSPAAGAAEPPNGRSRGATVAPLRSETQPREAKPRDEANREGGVLSLSGGHLPYAELNALRREIAVGVRGGAPRVPLATLAKELAACPDELAAEAVLEALLKGPLEAQLGVLEGFSTNREPRVHAEIARVLRSRPDSADAVLVGRALAAMPGADVTRLLALEAELRPGSGDLPRLLFESLARRPADELAPIASNIGRAARRERHGLTEAWASRAVRAAAGGSPDSQIVPSDGLFPERWSTAEGAAFLIEGQADLDKEFSVSLKGADRSSRTRRDVVVAETLRALKALEETRGSANIFLLGDSGVRWQEHVVPLRKGQVEDAALFLERRLSSVSREVIRPLQSAFDDPGVEEIWVVAVGLPERSDDDSDTSRTTRRVHELFLRRNVVLNVVLPLGERFGPDSEAALADRADELRALLAYWRPLAAVTGGQVVVRETIRPPEESAPTEKKTRR